MGVAVAELPRSLLGAGLYRLPRAAQILRVPPARLRRWADGYTFRLGDAAHYMEPVVVREVEALHDDGVVTFRDLVELLFVARFRAEGVSLQVIRAAARRAREVLQVSHPFTERRFATDGRSIFADLINRDDTSVQMARSRLIEEVHTGQRVFVEIVSPFLRKYLEFGSDSIERYRPPEGAHRVVLDPLRHFGAPVDDETGVPTEAVFAEFRSLGSAAAVASWFDIPVTAAKTAIEFERTIRGAA
jgi:hypothetical protein